jgi:hypothetical protein
MKTVYDMSTGQVEQAADMADDAQRPATDVAAYELQLRLQPVTEESIPERGLPPELVLADLNAFLDKMR